MTEPDSELLKVARAVAHTDNTDALHELLCSMRPGPGGRSRVHAAPCVVDLARKLVSERDMDVRPVCERCRQRRAFAEMDYLSVDGVDWWACTSCRDALDRAQAKEGAR